MGEVFIKSAAVLFLGIFTVAIFAFIFFFSQYFRFNLAAVLLFSLFPVTAAAFYLWNLPTAVLYRFLPFFAVASLSIFAGSLFVLKIFIRQGLGEGKKIIRRLDDFSMKNSGKISDFGGVLLTFDDGPSEIWTEKILEILKKNNIRAVFFVLGENVQKNPEIIKNLKDAGMEIGVHSFSHLPFPFLFSGNIKNEIDSTIEAVESAGGGKPKYFRPPWGFYNREVLEVAGERGLECMLWSRSTVDWSGISAEEIVKNALIDLEEGEIILLHDGHKLGAKRENTTFAVEKILETEEKIKMKSGYFPCSKAGKI